MSRFFNRNYFSTYILIRLNWNYSIYRGHGRYCIDFGHLDTDHKFGFCGDTTYLFKWLRFGCQYHDCHIQYWNFNQYYVSIWVRKCTRVALVSKNVKFLAEDCPAWGIRIAQEYHHVKLSDRIYSSQNLILRRWRLFEIIYRYRLERAVFEILVFKIRIETQIAFLYLYLKHSIWKYFVFKYNTF